MVPYCVNARARAGTFDLDLECAHTPRVASMLVAVAVRASSGLAQREGSITMLYPDSKSDHLLKKKAKVSAGAAQERERSLHPLLQVRWMCQGM